MGLRVICGCWWMGRVSGCGCEGQADGAANSSIERRRWLTPSIIINTSRRSVYDVTKFMDEHPGESQASCPSLSTHGSHRLTSSPIPSSFPYALARRRRRSPDSRSRQGRHRGIRGRRSLGRCAFVAAGYACWVDSGWGEYDKAAMMSERDMKKRTY